MKGLAVIYLQTERLIIRDPQPADIDGYHRLLSDELTLYYWQGIASSSLEQNRRALDEAIAEANQPCRTKYFFTVDHRETNRYIGTVGYTVIQTTPIGKVVDAGYAILPEYRGQGYATEALRALIRFAFEEDGVFRFVAGCRTENQASEGVLQKCGMIKEAEFKCHTWHEGQMKGRVEYRMLRDEYQSRGTTYRIY